MENTVLESQVLPCEYCEFSYFWIKITAKYPWQSPVFVVVFWKFSEHFQSIVYQIFLNMSFVKSRDHLKSSRPEVTSKRDVIGLQRDSRKGVFL